MRGKNIKNEVADLVGGALVIIAAGGVLVWTIGGGMDRLVLGDRIAKAQEALNAFRNSASPASQQIIKRERNYIYNYFMRSFSYEDAVTDTAITEMFITETVKDREIQAKKNGITLTDTQIQDIIVEAEGVAFDVATDKNNIGISIQHSEFGEDLTTRYSLTHQVEDKLERKLTPRKQLDPAFGEDERIIKQLDWVK